MTTTVAPTPAPPARNRGPSKGKEALIALAWLAPALALIVGVVLYPAYLMIKNSFRKFNVVGFELGDAGWNNYKLALNFPGAPMAKIFVNTVLWVVVVVTVTLIISNGLAQFLNKQFRGRKLVRLAIVIPWACSVVMTTAVFAYGLDPNFGVMNRLFVDLGILDKPYGFAQNPVAAFWTAVVVAIFVSLPFTTYTILAGLQAVPNDILEAAHMDGANSRQRYWQIVFPVIRPALAVAALINIINVFNSLPILQILNKTPGYNEGNTTTTMIFQFKTKVGPGVSSALSVVNFLICLVVIVIYLVIVKPTKETDR